MCRRRSLSDNLQDSRHTSLIFKQIKFLLRTLSLTEKHQQLIVISVCACFKLSSGKDRGGIPRKMNGAPAQIWLLLSSLSSN